MAARDDTIGGEGRGGGGHVGNAGRRLTTETKQFFQTSEFVAYVIVFLGILIAANQIEGEGGDDYFGADKAWLYITILTLGYMLSRGIAKSGVREPYSSDSGDGHRQANVLRFTKRPGRRTEVRFMPGCLVGSILLSIGLTVLINVLIRLF